MSGALTLLNQPGLGVLTHLLEEVSVQCRHGNAAFLPAPQPTSPFPALVPASFGCGASECSRGFFQRDVHVAMRALQLFPNGVSGKLNVFLAKETGHFQIFRLSQCDGCLAMGAGDFLSEVLG